MWPVLLLSAAASPVPPTILATCGASSGTGYYVIDGKGAWNNDAQSTGKLTFIIAQDGKANLIYSSEFDGTVDTRADGGLVFLSRSDEVKGEFGMAVIYPKSGTSETYSVLRLANAKRQVLWTQNKAHVGPDGRLSSAKVFTADCD